MKLNSYFSGDRYMITLDREELERISEWYENLNAGGNPSTRDDALAATIVSILMGTYTI